MAETNEQIILGFQYTGADDAKRFLATLDEIAGVGSKLSQTGETAVDPTAGLDALNAALRQTKGGIDTVRTAFNSAFNDPLKGVQALTAAMEKLQQVSLTVSAAQQSLAKGGLTNESLIPIGPAAQGRYSVSMAGGVLSPGYIQRTSPGYFAAYDPSGAQIGAAQRSRVGAATDLVSAQLTQASKDAMLLVGDLGGTLRGLQEPMQALDARTKAVADDLTASGRRITESLDQAGAKVLRWSDDLARKSGVTTIPIGGGAISEVTGPYQADPAVMAMGVAKRRQLAKDLNQQYVDTLVQSFPEQEMQIRNALQRAVASGFANAGGLQHLTPELQKLIQATPEQIASGDLGQYRTLLGARNGLPISVPAMINPTQRESGLFSPEAAQAIRQTITSFLEAKTAAEQLAVSERTASAALARIQTFMGLGQGMRGGYQPSLFAPSPEEVQASQAAAKAAEVGQMALFDAEQQVASGSQRAAAGLESVYRLLSGRYQPLAGGAGAGGIIPPGGTAAAGAEDPNQNPFLIAAGLGVKNRIDKMGDVTGFSDTFALDSKAIGIGQQAQLRARAAKLVTEVANSWVDDIGATLMDESVKGTPVSEQILQLRSHFQSLFAPEAGGGTVASRYLQENLGLEQRPNDVQVNRFLQQAEAGLVALANATKAPVAGLDLLGRSAQIAAQQESVASKTGISKTIAEFQEGFRGRRGLDFAEQIGQTAKFSLLYGTAYQALYMFRQGLQQAVQEAVAYNSALTDLAIATHSTKDAVAGLADSTARTATSYGLSPSQGVETATRAVGIFDLNNAPANVRNYETEQFTRAVSQLNFVTGRDVTQITEDVGSIAQAFGLAASQASQVQDLDAFFSRRFGSALGGTLESVAQIGSIAKDAGFSLEEASAIASKLQSRTGQTPQAVAGLMSQFLGRSGDPALQAKLAQLGIDTSVPFKQQIEQLSQAQLSQSQRLFIENAFGRGRSGQAASIIIQDFGEIQKAAQAAITQAPGLGEKQLAQRMATVGGQLKEMGGLVKQITVDLGNSGLLGVLGLVLIVFKQLLQGVDDVLRLWNTLPAHLREVILGLGVFAAALKFTAAGEAVKGVVGAAKEVGLSKAIFGGPTASLEGALARVAGTAPAAASAAELGTAGGAIARGGGILGAASALTGLSTAAIATTGGLATLAIGVGVAAAQASAYSKSISDANTALQANLSQAHTSEQFTAAAASLRQQATLTDQGQGVFLNIITAGGAERAADAKVTALRASADYAQRTSELVKNMEDQAAAAQKLTVFGDPATATIDDLAKGMDTLARNGVDATKSFNLLAKAVGSVGQGRQALYDPQVAAREFASNLVGARAALGSENIPGLTSLTPGGAGPGHGGVVSGGVAGSTVLSQLEGLNEDQLAAYFTKQFGTKRPHATDIRTLVGNIVKDMHITIPGAQQTQDAINDAITKLLTKGLQAYTLRFQRGRQYSGQEAVQILQNQLEPAAQNNLSRLQALGLEGSPQYQAALERITDAYRQLAKQTSGPTPGVIADAIAQANDAAISGAIANLEEIRQIQEARANGDKQIAAIRAKFAQLESRKILGPGGRLLTHNFSIIKDVLSRANKAEFDAVKAAINNAIATVENSLATQRAIVVANQSLTAVVSTMGAKMAEVIGASTDVNTKASAAVANFRKQLAGWKDLKTNVDSLSYDVGSAYDTSGSSGSGAGSAGPTDTAAQIAAAQATAEAIRKRGAVAQAAAQLQSARADLDAAKKGTVAYYQALGAFYQAQQALADATRQDRINQYLLGHDTTDPVVQARAQLMAARQKLAYDQRTGASADQLRQDRLDQESQQNNLQSTKFQQWLSDLQTAEQLGRISHAAYIRYLENRKQRLEDIKHRTRQEQDMLDQVSQTLQSAQQAMAGQFNIGNIRIPTPYEARRYVEERRKQQIDAPLQAAQQQLAAPSPSSFGTSTSTQTATQNVAIQIDGADTAQIRRVLTDILGQRAQNTTSTRTGKR